MTHLIKLNADCERLVPSERVRDLVPGKLHVEAYRDETGSTRHVIVLPMLHVDFCTDDMDLLSDELLMERYLMPALNCLGNVAKWRCELG